jgi:trimethylamine--corrinoid protein Co-methyltransferase
MALAGGSSPVTLAGTLITHNAEVLSGIVLSQLTCKGSPVIYGSSTTIMDMKSTTAAVGAPELGMINAAVAKLAQYYLLPSWVAGG